MVHISSALNIAAVFRVSPSGCVVSPRSRQAETREGGEDDEGITQPATRPHTVLIQKVVMLTYVIQISIESPSWFLPQDLEE
ncbi:hypothetical protein E4U42_006385 [Claviceps africana]|uniref:Uncharacterized protein n=1 Tax=Claviceps africana TaxID=83212 RepID=A0A8K0NGR6_9HYPO|nr:hypothetical protein E4U42_006385 [Claviceps africana]